MIIKGKIDWFRYFVVILLTSLQIQADRCWRQFSVNITDTFSKHFTMKRCINFMLYDLWGLFCLYFYLGFIRFFFISYNWSYVWTPLQFQTTWVLEYRCHFDFSIHFSLKPYIEGSFYDKLENVCKIKFVT